MEARTPDSDRLPLVVIPLIRSIGLPSLSDTAVRNQTDGRSRGHTVNLYPLGPVLL